MAPTSPAEAVLRWHVDAGVDEAVSAEPTNWFAKTPPEPAQPASAPRAPAPVTRITPSAPPSADEAIAAATRIAGACRDLRDVEEALKAFDGCPLKGGAVNTVFADGIAGAPLMVIGEAPGRDEDIAGKPFVGRAGQLLDRMLAAIGRSRGKDVFITNVVFWRPPGNRTPTQVETAICRPFVDRAIELTAPKAVMLAGGAPTQTLLGLAGIMRARGTWRTLTTASGASYEALPVFHPAFLLRQPAQKRLAWRDLQSLRDRLRGD